MPVKWPADSQKCDVHISQESLCELIFGSHQDKGKSYRKHCYNLMYPHIRPQLTNKMEEDHQLKITGIQRQHYWQATELQQAITDRGNQMQAMRYENVDH